MRRSHALLAAIAVLGIVAAGVFAALYFTKESDESSGAEACGDRTFGHITFIGEEDGELRMRFDPAWFTSGITANTAAAEDGVVEPGEPVPNDNYRVEEGHRLLTYRVDAEAQVTVLTRQGDPANFGATPISVSELAALVRGEHPVELFEPLDSGVWIRVNVDTVCSIEQQYQP